MSAAKGVMSGSAYLGDKAALETAREILASNTQQFGSKAISATQATVDETDITTQVALNKAKQTLAAIVHGPEQDLVDSTKTTLNKFISANQAALKAANEAIANITQAVEYVVYQTALHSLAAAQQSTTRDPHRTHFGDENTRLDDLRNAICLNLASIFTAQRLGLVAYGYTSENQLLQGAQLF
ncbi:hypothetical protein DFH08DRAFT_1083812 [Mycena albidolilacea]|uniref:Uncharacterized protein n=1 Tax=Mycena albidolilacea TaxID=1033008 RepID=A0AAD7ELJ2_9AGAR|nr:hypothetical protein DFH08DRAFT_1083812 [Mycena albidolilacea]